MSKANQTSWGGVAEWYEELLSGKDTYQEKVIMPNLLRLMEIKTGESVLDIGCGTGFFSNVFHKAGANVTGVDVGKELIEIAKKQFSRIRFEVSSAEKMPVIKNESFDKAVMVLSLQNMKDAGAAIGEAARALKKEGKLFLVLNHPCFRIPGESSWGWDERKKIQYRRLDGYLSEKKIKIQMHPGENPSEITWSFHRPLQFYFKFLGKKGLLVERLEEWVSHKETSAGPRKEAENKARSEFPMFMFLQAVKR